MANYVRTAIPDDQILLESSSQSTRESALFIRDMLRDLPPGKIILLTSDYHLRRSLAVFRRVGIDVTGVAAPYTSIRSGHPLERPVLLQELLIEDAKRIYYRWNGWS